MNAVQILKEARALIADEKKWTQFTLARDYVGNFVDVDSPMATCFCSEGAVKRVMVDSNASMDDWDYVYPSVLAALNAQVPHGNIADFNDTSSHIDVRLAFDRAIARAESGAA